MAHHVSNINLRGRLTQIIVLVILILSGVLLSQFANAQVFGKKSRFDKPKYRITVHNNSSKVCSILNKKRLSKPKTAMFASNKTYSSKRNRKALAETEN